MRTGVLGFEFKTDINDPHSGNVMDLLGDSMQVDSENSHGRLENLYQLK